MKQELFYLHAVFANEQSLFLLRDDRERGTSSERRSRIGEETKSDIGHARVVSLSRKRDFFFGQTLG